MSQQTAGWDVIPFESSKTAKPSLFWKLGNKLGNIFISAKHKAKSKYVEVTKGINQRIAEEDEMRALELQMFLDEQAAEYEQEISRIKRKMFFWALLAAIIAFICGMATVFGSQLSLI
ncbi:hypothetical protein AB6W79_10830 [Pasteurella multocida]|uniref:hypothetical protein n=1 Tax=Pasteurella multocida TaxID=747 RepID=UPI0029AB40C1|nr:hypothetical protein [Pasteurella multocida]MDX3903957.1 hypothetical protein [Pasteurella multocida]MDX3983533.1 hypothetical protein [Pasteurella multocida]